MSDYPTTILRDIESPPGGWRFTVAETGLLVRAPYFWQLQKRVLDHMMANNVPIPPDFEEWFADAACHENGHGAPWCGPPPPQKHPQMADVLSLGVAKRFLRTVLHAIRDHKFVPKDEALRRAAVCMDCPLATEIGGCRGCGSVFAVVKRVMPDNPVSMPKEKEFCGACGCWIQAKVWLENATLDAAEKGDRPAYWENCWRNS